MLPRLRAEEQLAAINAATFPYLEAQDRRQYVRALEAQAGHDRTPQRPTRADLRSIGIRVEGEE